MDPFLSVGKLSEWTDALKASFLKIPGFNLVFINFSVEYYFVFPFVDTEILHKHIAYQGPLWKCLNRAYPKMSQPRSLLF